MFRRLPTVGDVLIVSLTADMGGWAIAHVVMQTIRSTATGEGDARFTRDVVIECPSSSLDAGEAIVSRPKAFPVRAPSSRDRPFASFLTVITVTAYAPRTVNTDTVLHGASQKEGNTTLDRETIPDGDPEEGEAERAHPLQTPLEIVPGVAIAAVRIRGTFIASRPCIMAPRDREGVLDVRGLILTSEAIPGRPCLMEPMEETAIRIGAGLDPLLRLDIGARTGLRDLP